MGNFTTVYSLSSHFKSGYVSLTLYLNTNYSGSKLSEGDLRGCQRDSEK